MKKLKKVVLIATIAALIVLLTGNVFSKNNPTREDSFTILYTADEHSSLVPHTPAIDYHPEKDDPTIGGFSRLATALSDIKDEVKTQENIIKVSAGDFLSGNPFSWLSLKGHTPELDLLQELGFDIVTLGNHEYDFGPDFLSRHLRMAGYPEENNTTLLATNTYFTAGHSLSERGIEEYKIKELPGGTKVGFIGILGTDAKYFIQDVEPIEFLPQVEAAENAVKNLKQKSADVIVSVNHAGLEVNKILAEEIEEIDVIVGGHTHKTIFEPIYFNDTIIVQPGSHLKYLGRLELSYNLDSEELKVINEEKDIDHLVKIDDSIEEDRVIRGLINEYILEFNRWIDELTGGVIDDILQTVATSKEVIERGPAKSETPLGNLMTDSMLKEVQKATGKDIDFAFQVNGQIRDDVLPGSMENVKNKVTFYDLARVAGMGQTYEGNPGYPLTVIKLTDKEIRRFLEGTLLASEFAGNRAFFQISGLRYTYDPDRVVLFNFPYRNIPVPTLRAIESVEKYVGSGLQGHDLEDYIPLEESEKETYKIVVDNYVLEFINMAGDYLPFFYSIEPKDTDGEPINKDNLNDYIVYENDKPLTVWQALVNFSKEEEDISHYSQTQGRINRTSMISPFITLSIAGVIIFGFAAGIIVFIRRKRQSEKI